MKAFVLSLMVAMCTVMPLQAQIDGFFRGGSNDNYSNRDEISSPGNDTNGISNNGIGQPEPSPLGSGLLIMVAAGAGYAMVRRKRVRKGMTMILALALILGMTQCKKKADIINNQASSGMYITLDVSGGAKVAVTPGFIDPVTNEEYAKVDFENGDIIYVGHNRKYVGQLTYSDGSFTGTIDDNYLTTDDYLYFYFLGNKIPYETATAGATTLSVNIIDQTAKYPVISYARSNELFDPNEHSYSAYLLNYCAIQKFTTNVDKVIKIKGMKNKVILDFTNTSTPYSYDYVDSEGAILMHRESADDEEGDYVSWAILCPQEAVTAASATAAGYGTSSTFPVHKIDRNGYYKEPIEIELNETGIIDGAVTVYGDKQVYFASGNLQYQASSGTWRFALNQWDYVGDATNGNVYENNVKSSNTSIASNYSGWIDLFGWGTSGWDPSSAGITDITNYQPWATDNRITSDLYSSHYGPRYNYTDIGVTTSVYYNPIYQQNEDIMHIEGTYCDWGTYLSSLATGGITNGGSLSYRTLSFYDGMTLVQRKNTINGAEVGLIGFGYVNNVYGFIVLPDNWDGSIAPDFKYYTFKNPMNPDPIVNNEYNESTTPKWSTMEAYGVVFAPAAGYRNGTTIHNIQDAFYCWTSTAPGDTDETSFPFTKWANIGQFGYASSPIVTNSNYRYLGCSVRLYHNKD